MPGPVNPLAPGVQVTNNGLEIADGTNVRATLGKLPDGTYCLLIYNGAIELIDQFGQTIMSNGAFTGPMLDFIQSGIYNNMFVAGTPGVLPIGTSRNDAAGRTSGCPGWTVSRGSGMGTATFTADTTWPGKNYVGCAFSGIGTSTTNNVALTSDLAPVVPGSQLTIQSFWAYNVPAGAPALNVNWGLLFYDANQTYISTSAVSQLFIGPQSATMTPLIIDTTMVPSTARFFRLEANAWETLSHDAATYFRLGLGAVLMQWSPANIYSDIFIGGSANISGDANISGTAF